MKVPCCSMTESSTEVPQPSFKISTPKILQLAPAPYSFEATMVMSKGRTWSAYQGWAISLKPATVDRGMLSMSVTEAFTGMGASMVREELKAPARSETLSWAPADFLFEPNCINIYMYIPSKTPQRNARAGKEEPMPR